MKIVNVIGAGLAGSEASYQLAKRGIKVNLFEMKPNKFTPAHKSPNFAELVCSNSLKSKDISNASGLLKEEMRRLDSLVIKMADKAEVPAGASLSVDRELFSKSITEEILKNENINVINQKIDKLDLSIPTILATGPLTTSELFNNLQELLGEKYLYFYDAIAPIVSADSLDKTKCFEANRYDKDCSNGQGDYINCPMNKEEYELFYNELINAETAHLHEFEDLKVFEGCMPVEVMAKRGYKSLLFGPLKPVGLIDPNTNIRPYAVVQLRKEDNLSSSYNLVGFQTNLTFKEQKRVFGLIPALKNAEYIRYGVMHRNSFINAPKVLNEFYQTKKYPNLFIAGQLSGVEGYIESVASGLTAGINMFRYINNLEPIKLSPKTCIGGLIQYITTTSGKNFQPMGSNWAIVEPLKEEIKDKKLKKLKMSEIALQEIENYKNQIGE